MNNLQSCASCWFWLPDHDGAETGGCHRYAPRGRGQAYWPDTDDDDWCGEYSSKLPAANDTGGSTDAR